jgi:anti-anti-sigma factor
MASQPGRDDSVVIEECGLQLSSRFSDGVHTISLRGEIDLSNADVFTAELTRAIEAEARILIDMSSLEFIDSHGLRVLVRAADELSETRQLEVIRPPAEVGRVLALTGIDQRLRYVE